ncbi:DUF2306 domain-containing protein [Roseibium sp.]|uniref:DUF2306 domain-containing protein n=1 Tax=Roseibium sp. TaxID=1936156 RepID=UPI003A97E0FA
MKNVVGKFSPSALAAAVLCLLVAVASYRFVPLGVPNAMDYLAHHLPENRWFLYGHIAVAPLALALLPLQLSSRLRQSFPRLHRWGGRFYVLLILVSGVSGVNLALTTQSGPVAGTGFGALAVLWLVTTGLGWRRALARDFQSHRHWMIRSAALTFAAVTLRIYLPIAMVTDLPFSAAYSAIAWLCWVPNLIAAEIYLRRRPRFEAVSVVAT